MILIEELLIMENTWDTASEGEFYQFKLQSSEAAQGLSLQSDFSFKNDYLEFEDYPNN